MTDIIKKTFTISDFKSSSDEERRFEALITTSTKDRDNEVVLS